jgi:hypothetical protein
MQDVFLSPSQSTGRESAVHLKSRREACCLLSLLAFAAGSGVRAQTSSVSRPSLERFIQLAKLPPQSRLWGNQFAKIAKSPSHPLYALVAQVQGSNEPELLALLVQTFQALTEDEANDLVATLSTPLGQWVVESSMWAREFVLSGPVEGNRDLSKRSGSAPRRLSNTEIQTIKAFGDTLHWQALRRVGKTSFLGSELMMTLDWPQFIDLML